MGAPAVAGGGLLLPPQLSENTAAKLTAPTDQTPAIRMSFMKKVSAPLAGQRVSDACEQDTALTAGAYARSLGYCLTKWNGIATCWEQPMAGKRQFRTSFSMHFATDGSSPVALTL